MPAISFSSVDLPEPLRPTIPNASPGRTWRSMSRSAQSSRVCGSSRRRIASFSERVGVSVILNSRPIPRPTISPRRSVATSEFDGKTVLVALHHPEADEGESGSDDEDVDEQRRTWDRRLQKRCAEALDIRRDGVPVAQQVDQ